MDIALFAGFAARGPCNRAVAVDSVAAFEACFGGDLPLARDRESGKMVQANLPPAVRAFFANGGHRCWVVRLARTRTHEKRWVRHTGAHLLATAHMAHANQFPVGGMLCRLPNGFEGESMVQAAEMQAASFGSWSDDLRLSVRLNQYPFAASGMSAIPFGLKMADPGGLSPGDLIEFQSGDGKVRRYAKIVRPDGTDLLAIWCASFSSAMFRGPKRLGAIVPTRSETQEIFDHRQTSGRPVELTLPQAVPDLESQNWLKYQRTNDWIWVLVDSVDGLSVTGTAWRVQDGEALIAGAKDYHTATLIEGLQTQIVVAIDETGKLPGTWLHFRSQGEAVWMHVDRADAGALHGPAWQQIASRLPRGRFSARRLTVDIKAELNGSEQMLTDIGLGLSGEDSVHTLLTDDEDYAADDARKARARFALSSNLYNRGSVLQAEAVAKVRGFGELAVLFGTPAFTGVHRAALRHAWLPLQIGPAFDAGSTASPTGRTALARDGLSLFDATLFLDPALAEASVGQIMPLIEQVRDIDEQQLTGIYAGMDAPDTEFGVASILAVPDAAQPGWEQVTPSSIPGTPRSDAPDRANWYDHKDGCSANISEDPKNQRSGPDRGRFLDCTTRLIDAPLLIGPIQAVADDSFALDWTGGEAGATFVLEESGSADFTGSVEIYRGEGRHFDVRLKGEGVYYYRVYAELDGNVSAYSAVYVVVGQASHQTLPADKALLTRLHLAIMRLAAGSADMFAVLSLPQSFRSKDALAHSSGLRTIADGFGGHSALGRNEERALSYAALYHPWLYYRPNRNPEASNAELAMCAPDGCVAGQMAATALRRGAWIAPANDLFSDIIGLTPLLPDGEQTLLYREKINMVRRDPNGFLLMDADTLSSETEWQQINVRRLMILLRRLAIMRGETFVFGNNDNVTRRAVETDLTFALDGMQRRGAFAGKTSAQSFRIAADVATGDLDNGRMVFEIGVAPSQPMRFLNIRLVQQGARLTVAEEAA